MSLGWQKDNYEKLRDRKIENAKRWSKNNKMKRKEIVNKSHNKLRLDVLSHYGGNPPECACCGERMIQFLALDHINGGGNEQRKKVGNVYQWVKANAFPVGYQVLCHNCNQAKGWYGQCPHKICQ